VYATLRATHIPPEAEGRCAVPALVIGAIFRVVGSPPHFQPVAEAQLDCGLFSTGWLSLSVSQFDGVWPSDALPIRIQRME
jgi:hypothetical protein